MIEVEMKKKYLSQYLSCAQLVKDIEIEIKENVVNSNIPEDFSSLQTLSRNHEVLMSYMALRDELVGKLINSRYRKIKCYLEIFGKIDSMENETEKRLLFLKYIKGKTWEKTADEMGYSVRNIYNIFNSALANIEI